MTAIHELLTSKFGKLQMAKSLPVQDDILLTLLKLLELLEVAQRFVSGLFDFL